MDLSDEAINAWVQAHPYIAWPLIIAFAVFITPFLIRPLFEMLAVMAIMVATGVVAVSATLVGYTYVVWLRPLVWGYKRVRDRIKKSEKYAKKVQRGG